MIIGLTGKNASGKGEVADYLKAKGFGYFSLSDELREEANERGIETTRANLIRLGNKLREEFGANYLTRKINEKINDDENFVVDSIRNPEEINELRKNKNFILVGVDAPVEIRFERAVKRGRVGDAKTLEEFKELEQRENLKNKTGQQLDECLKGADKLIVNDGSIEELHKKISLLIKQ